MEPETPQRTENRFFPWFQIEWLTSPRTLRVPQHIVEKSTGELSLFGVEVLAGLHPRNRIVPGQMLVEERSPFLGHVGIFLSTSNHLRHPDLSGDPAAAEVLAVG